MIRCIRDSTKSLVLHFKFMVKSYVIRNQFLYLFSFLIEHALQSYTVIGCSCTSKASAILNNSSYFYSFFFISGIKICFLSIPVPYQLSCITSLRRSGDGSSTHSMESCWLFMRSWSASLLACRSLSFTSNCRLKIIAGGGDPSVVLG